jgi:hypothetical protein
MTAKEALHDLIDALPEDQLHTVRLVVEFLAFRQLRDRVAHGLATPDELRRFLESREHGDFVVSERGDTFEDDPLLRAFLDAPEDDEPLTPDDVAAIEAGKADIARGEVVPWEEAKARLLGHS